MLARYTDVLTTFYSLYNSVMKIVYIAAHCCIIALIRCNGQIASTYDRDQDGFPHWKFLVVPCAVLATLTHLISGMGLDRFLYQGCYVQGCNRLFLYVQELLWMFSIYLEAVAIVPQLSLLRKYRIVDNLTGNYVFFMGVYRFLYIINWVYRAYYEPWYRHHYVVYACGCLQVALYMDFFYYWFTSKIQGRELRYGEDGDEEYDCDVNELRDYDNSTALIDGADLRLRSKPASTGVAEGTERPKPNPPGVDEEIKRLIEEEWGEGATLW